LKKVILIVAALVALIVIGAFVYISMMDWNAHKDKIADQFSNVTGKEVVFEGPVNFKVFPSPYLSAENVKIYDKNRSANPKALAIIKRMQVDLSLVSLFGGDFDVKRMVISEPEMIVEILPEGKINWQSPINYDQAEGSIDVVLDSVTIEKATLNIISHEDDINITLDNLNAEVIGESIFGPYRIEGTYIKDNNPEGFAVSLGRFSDSFATTLNFVINHPHSSTYLRFDGSFFLKNSAVNGSVVFESAKVVDFLNTYFHYDVDPVFEYPLAVSLEVNTNKTKIDVSNFVVKYGETVGAGNVLIPFKSKDDYSDKKDEERQKMEISFNMTDLDLAPVIEAFKTAGKYYDKDKQKFELDLGYDVLFDMKSVKTMYNEQIIRDFNVSADILKDNVMINSVGAILPGETSFTSKGKIFAHDDVLTYNFETSTNSVDAFKMFQWLGYEIPTVNQFTYRGVELTTSVSGNLKNIKISPLNLKIDKSIIDGEIGIARGERANVLMNLNIDSINFDNYLEKAPANISSKGMEEEFIYWFNKLSFLNDVDMHFDSTLGLGIYSAIPFEDTNLSFTLKDGTMDINNLSISSVKNSSVDFKGEIEGFGSDIKVSNLKYGIDTQNFYSVFPEDSLPDILKRAKDFKKFSAKGVVTGDLGRFATKSVFKVDNFDLAYSGNIMRSGDVNSYDGKIELRAPDFVKFLNRFDIKYNPKVISMGVLRLKSSVKGTYGDFELKDMETYIGSNKFEGELSYKKSGDRPDIVTNMNISRFEFDRFFYNANKNSETSGNFSIQSSGEAEFLAKPYFDKTKIDYAPYTFANVKGNIVIDALTYKNELINQAKFNLNISDSEIKVSNFLGYYANSELTGDISIAAAGENKAVGKVSLKDKPLERLFLGTKYGLDGGILSNVLIEFSSFASSESDFMTNLTGNINFRISNPGIVGWSLDVIEADLFRRSVYEGLPALALDNIQTGKTEFTDFIGDIVLNNGNYKFKDVSLTSGKYTIPITAEGNIDLWDVKSSFVVEMKNVQGLPSFKFSFNGPLSTPVPTVDVQDIGIIYQQRLDAIEENERQKEAERVDKLIFLMGEQQDRAVLLEKDLAKKIDFIETRLNVAESPEVRAKYGDILSHLDALKENIDYVAATSEEDDETYTNELIGKAKAINDAAEKDAAVIQPEIDEVYLQDIKDLVNRKYNLLANMFKKSRNDIVQYRDEFIEYPKRLAIIEKVSLVNDDKKVNDLKELIEEEFSKLDAQNTEASKDYVNIQTVTAVSELEGYVAKADEMIETYKTEEAGLLSSISELMAYLEEIAVREEAAYDKIAEEELKKQKIEENKGSISSSTGKSVTVVRDLEDIQRSEESQQNEEIPVLDFSKAGKTSQAATTTTQSRTVLTREEINAKISTSSNDGVLKKTDGEVSGASGSIIKK
jgi:hypothetical protein